MTWNTEIYYCNRDQRKQQSCGNRVTIPKLNLNILDSNSKKTLQFLI